MKIDVQVTLNKFHGHSSDSKKKLYFSKNSLTLVILDCCHSTCVLVAIARAHLFLTSCIYRKLQFIRVYKIFSLIHSSAIEE